MFLFYIYIWGWVG